jgi:hypothetical protein
VQSLEAEKVQMELVEDELPEITALLREVGLSDLQDRFFASGFTETKYIMRMKDMDLRIMVSSPQAHSQPSQRTNMKGLIARRAVSSRHWIGGWTRTRSFE